MTLARDDGISGTRATRARFDAWTTSNGTIRRRAVPAGEGVRRPPPQGSMLRFYSDESPGLKITPVVVLGMSVCFIGFVTMLHAIAKIAAYTSGK